MKYTLSQIAEICGGVLRGRDSTVESVVVDSRNSHLGVGALFVAIGGANHDGHNFLGNMFASGVVGFVVEREVDTELYPDAGFVVVPSSVAALQALAAHYRAEFRGTVVAITGSNGKTIVKEWIAQLVPPNVRLFRSPKSYNSQVGVALSLLLMRGDEDVAIVEAGISEMGEMERLNAMIRPEIGIFTTIGDAHQENFQTVEQKIQQKIKLFDGARKVLYNSSYGGLMEQLSSLTAEIVDVSGLEHEIDRFDERSAQENAAMAVGFWDAMGVEHAQTIARLDSLQPVAMRLELREGVNNSLIINDSYNSDINSLAIALDYLKSVSGGRKQTLVLSDILQSGMGSDELYRAVAQMITLNGVDHLVGIGDQLRLHSDLFGCSKEFYSSTEAFLVAINREHTSDRVVLIKGNRQSQFERLSHALQLKSHTTTLEVDLDAMIENLNYFRSRIKPQTRIMVMVKAFGYGSGGYEVANMLQHQGVHYLAVAFADEGVQLRERGITMPIVVLNADADSFELMVANGLEPEIYNFSSFDSFIDVLNRYGESSYHVHIKLDTGMHRLGFEVQDIERLNALIASHSAQIRVASVFSHLAAADDPTQDKFTQSQIDNFTEMSLQIVEPLNYNPLLHIANTATIERFPTAQFDMCRLGIGLYGVGEQSSKLRLTSSLKSRIVQIKHVDALQTVGYGREGRVTTPTIIATVPIGYADGLDRHLGNGRWSMVVVGKRAPIVGRVCMDTCMIDITDIETHEGDLVTVWGSDDGNTVVDMAQVLGTIPYEVLTSVSARVKRIYLKE